MLSLGMAAGPSVGGILYSIAGIQVACVGGGAVSLINFFLVAIFLVDSRESQTTSAAGHGHGPAVANGGSTPAAAPRIAWQIFALYFASFLFAPIISIFETFANLYLEETYFNGDVEKATHFFSACVTCVGIAIFLVSMFLYARVTKIIGADCTVICFGSLAVV